MIRKATAEDMERLLQMGERFVSETPYRDLITLSPERLAETMVNVLSSDDGAIFVSGSDATVTGMIALVLADHPYSGERIASELVWWVEPEARGHGVRLLKAAEAWALERGAKSMLMVAPIASSVGDLYARMGYAAVETSYQRRL